MGKIYAVRRGKSTGLFNDWPSCQEAVKGYSGAEFSSFTDEKQALLYLMGEEVKKPTPKKSEVQKLTKSTQCNVFTKGTYEKGQSKCNVVVIVQDILDTKTYFAGVVDKYCDDQQTVAAELLSAFIGLQVAKELGYTEINLYSNYSGIREWAEKTWTPKNVVASSFVRYIDENKQDCKIQIYQLYDTDKEYKKTLKYYTGYACATRHIIPLQQILEGTIFEGSMEEYKE